MLLSIERKTVDPNILLVALAGRLTLGQETVKVEELLCSLVDEGIRKVVLDLTGLSYMDSAGMGAIAKSMSVITKAGGKLRLAGATQRVAAALRITKLDRVFPMYPDTESACADY